MHTITIKGDLGTDALFIQLSLIINAHFQVKFLLSGLLHLTSTKNAPCLLSLPLEQHIQV